MKLVKKIKLEGMLLLIVLSFIVFYLILAWFNTLSRDDNHFLYLVNTFGFFGAIKYYYFSWQGRVSAYAFTNLTLLIQPYFNGLFAWFIFLLSVFSLGIYFLLANILKRLGINYSKSDLVLFTGYLFIFFQEIVYDKSTIFWLATSASYYSGLAFLICGTALILSGKPGWMKLMLLFIVFFIVGSSLEHLAFISFFMLCSFLATAYFPGTKHFFYNDKLKIIFSLIALSIGICIMLVCPGLAVRRAQFPAPDVLTVFKVSANSIYHFYKFMLVPDLGRIILFSAPFIYLGHKLKPGSDSEGTKFVFKHVLTILIALIIMVILTFLIMAKGTGGMGQPRTLFHIAFFIALAFSAIGFILGYTSHISQPVALYLSYAAFIVFFMSISQNYSRTLPESIKYAESEKKRMDILYEEKSKGRTKALELDSLYYNKYVIYRTDEISNDTLGQWNQTLKQTVGIDFNISSFTVSYVED